MYWQSSVFHKNNNKMTQDNRDRDIANVVQALVGLLNRAIQEVGLERPNFGPKGMNEAYRLQTEMAHLLYDLTHGPVCLTQKVIADCNELINSVGCSGHKYHH